MIDLELKTGEALLVFTDGLSEALGGIQENIDMKNVKELWGRTDHTNSAEEQMSQLVQLFKARRTGQQAEDDLTLIILKKL